MHRRFEHATGQPAWFCVDVVKRFNGTSALRGVNLRVPYGSVTALIGPNGAGKSTLFRAAAGLVLPDSGTMTVGGRPAGSRAARSAVSFMPENPDLYPGVSASEHLTFIGLAYRVRGRRRHAADLLDRLGLADRADMLPNELSQGLRRRLAIAMALLRGARILLLDEPFNGLDARSAGELRALLRELAEDGAGVVVATHLLADVNRTADRVIVLNRGTVVSAGTAAEVVRAAGLPPHGSLEEAYLALTESGPTALTDVA
jgi:ABC-2 type transport system ATP-binding protein